MRNTEIHHRDAERGPEGPRVGAHAVGHLAVDPRNGDLVYDDFDDQLRRVTIDGEDSLVAEDVSSTAVDVGADGTVYVATRPGVVRIDTDGTRSTVIETPVYVEAVAVAGDGAVVYFTQGRLHRFADGTDTVLAGDGSSCLAPDPCGDFGPAAAARLGNVVLLEVTAGDDIVIGELYGRVRAIVDGGMRPVLGGHQRCSLAAPLSCGEGGPASRALVDNVVSLSMAGDTLYAVDERPDGRSSRLLRVGAALATPAQPHQGYRMIASDGGVFTFGWSPFHGSTGHLSLVSPIVAGRSNGADGYWFVAGDGGVFTFGRAGFFGSAAGLTNSPVVDMAVTPTGEGYWIAERDTAHLKSFGDAAGYGPPDDLQPYAALVNRDPALAHGALVEIVAERPRALPHLNRPLVAAHPTKSGRGTWYVASDGGVFTDGDAGFFGSTGDMRLNQPVLDLVPTPTEQGYWLIAADGGVFSFGDAEFLGSMGSVRLNRPVVAGVAGPSPSG